MSRRLLWAVLANASRLGHRIGSKGRWTARDLPFLNWFVFQVFFPLEDDKNCCSNDLVLLAHAVDTGLSAPFQRNIKHEILTPETSAQRLLDLILRLQLEDNGKFFAYDGTEIPCTATSSLPSPVWTKISGLLPGALREII
eukprot:1161523-Pelagomonas_calceolata.AAC.2